MAEAAPIRRPPVAPAASLPSSLPVLVEGVWAAMERGCEERWGAWGLPALATRGAGGEPQARVVALRRVDRAARTLWFHSDRRTAKVAALHANPRASLLFWSADDAVELRLQGTARVHADGALADDAWRDASSLSRSAAAISRAPGSALRQATPFAALADEGDASAARSNFCAVAFVAEALDWLWLGPRDLRRARMRWTGADWAGHWIVP